MMNKTPLCIQAIISFIHQFVVRCLNLFATGYCNNSAVNMDVEIDMTKTLQPPQSRDVVTLSLEFGLPLWLALDNRI